MNPSTEKALERAIRAMERSHRRPLRRFTLTPLITALGCGMAYLLLTYLLPRVWATTLPGGLETAARLGGWPGLVWRLAVVAHAHFIGVCVVSATIVFISTLLTRGGVVGRLLAWLLAVATVLVNGGILYVMIRVPVDVVISDVGITAPTVILPVETSPP
jgi:hypothetical protein